ncbi:MAG TPA: hypothetical protein VKZ18_21825 [Polyangia bacterium]|nr:hypothetical protein [Polyangia bacterium]
MTRSMAQSAAQPSWRPAVALAALALCACARPPRGTDVLTQHNDNARSGAVLTEIALTPARVAGGGLVRLYERNVSGGIVAQPLVVHDVPTSAHGKRDLLLVATEQSWVYAFDLRDESRDPAVRPLAARQLQPNGPIDPPICGETPSQRVGVTGTPVVDPATHTLFAVARNAADHQYYLHAVDLTSPTLRDRSPPVRIAATAEVAGGAPIPFQADCQRNRPALLLAGGIVYVGFGSLACDRDCPDGSPYRGWVLGYRALDLRQAAVFTTGADAGHAGIWQGGAGLVGAGDRIYFMTGNGPGALGDAFVALTATPDAPGLKLAAAHQPPDHAQLDRTDSDLGSGGPVWLPPGLIVGGGKQGRYEVLDAATLVPSQGFQAFVNAYHGDPGAPACAQQTRSLFPTNCDTSVPGCYVAPGRYGDGEDCGPNINGSPVFWPTAGPGFGLLYQMPGRDDLKAFRYRPAARRLDEAPYVTSQARAVEGMSGGFSALSANGDRDGILWVSYPLGDGQWQNVPGRLAAFDALTLRELWHDDGGYLFAKFTPPTIADGFVIRPTLSGRLVVYGLRPEDMPRSLPVRLLDRVTGMFRAEPPLPPAPIGRAAVDEKYRLTGGESGFLGSAAFDARPVQDAAGGWYRDFKGIVLGSVPSTVAARRDTRTPAEVAGRHPWLGLGTRVASSIYWSPSTGAHIVTGEIREAWLTHGGPAGPLGYPTDDDQPAPGGGRVCRFSGGEIDWSVASGPVIRASSPK